jgi:hypothetical protein
MKQEMVAVPRRAVTVIAVKRVKFARTANAKKNARIILNAIRITIIVRIVKTVFVSMHVTKVKAVLIMSVAVLRRKIA